MQNLTIKDWCASVRKLTHVSRRAFADMWPDNKSLIVRHAAVCAVIACLPYATYWLYGRAIGVIPNQETRDMALWLIAGVLAVSLIADLLQTLQGFGERQLWHRMEVRFNELFFSKKGALGIDAFDNPTIRDVVAKAQERRVWPIMQVAEGQFMNLSNAIRLSVALAIVGVYDWKLCLLVCIALIPQFLVDIRHGATLWMIFNAEIDTRRKYNELTSHIVNNARFAELKMFQNIAYFVRRIRDILDGFRETQEKAEKKKHLQAALATVASAVLIGTVIMLIVLRVVRGTMELSDFVFLWGSLQSLHTTLSGSLRAIAQQNEWALYAADNYAVMDAEPETAKHTGTIVCADRTPEITFKNVSFHYPWKSTDNLILRDVSFTIHPGERTALVGINGAGKTTVIKLLCGIYHPTEGHILIDGVDIRQLDIQSWRSKLAVLSQQFANHHTMVHEAIMYGDTNIVRDEARIKQAAAESKVDAFVADLPNGWNTVIGKEFTEGMELSGGQNQRMALGRVFYRRGRVIVLDEPTASLDTLAEAEIFGELEARPRDASLILITHRFNTIKNCDHIIVIDRGIVVEEGNHLTLMRQNGLYAEMFLKQARGYMTQPVKMQNDGEDS